MANYYLVSCFFFQNTLVYFLFLILYPCLLFSIFSLFILRDRFWHAPHHGFTLRQCYFSLLQFIHECSPMVAFLFLRHFQLYLSSWCLVLWIPGDNDVFSSCEHTNLPNVLWTLQEGTELSWSHHTLAPPSLYHSDGVSTHCSLACQPHLQDFPS